MPDRPPSSLRITDMEEADAWSLLTHEALDHLKRFYASNPDVWGYEVGVRELGGRIAEPREPCLKVFVYQKGLVSAENLAVDPWTSARREGMPRVSFRTDVVELGSLRAQTTTPEVLTEGTAGSATYVLESEQGLFLLTAAHVLAGAGSVGQEIVRWTKAGLTGSGRFDPADRRTYWPLWEGAGYGFGDVGLARLDSVNDLGPYRALGRTPTANDVVSWDEAPGVDRVTIHGRRRVYSARFTSRVPAGLMVSNDATGTTVRYWRLLRFQQVGTRHTEKGDSGAPIVSPDGRLVGIHVVGKETKNPQRYYSLAICMGDVMERFRPVLGDDLRLRVVQVA